MDEDVRAVLAREFPDRQVATVRPAARGNRKRTVIVGFAGGACPPAPDGVVVQFGPLPALRTETAVARAVRERTPVPVPRVLAAGRIGSDAAGRDSEPDAAHGRDRGYAVVERAPGADLHEQFVDLAPDARAAVAGAFGRYLAAVHDAFAGAFDAYGPIVAADGGDAPDAGVGDPGALAATGPDKWPAWLRDYAREGVRALPPALDDLRGPLRRAIDDADPPSRPPATLYPWDLRPGNALVADGRVTAVLDWGEPLAAPSALSVAKTGHLVADWYVDDPALRTAFRAGYRDVRPLPDVERIHRLVAVVRSAVDSRGEVTRPRYPELTGEDAVAFHRERLTELL